MKMYVFITGGYYFQSLRVYLILIVRLFCDRFYVLKLYHNNKYLILHNKYLL